MFGILCTQGHMSPRQIKTECVEQKFAPLLVMKANGDEDTILPVFTSQHTAMKFARRNLPKAWGLGGAVVLTQRDLDWFRDKGFAFSQMSFPRKLKDVVDFDIEILEYDESPDIEVHRV